MKRHKLSWGMIPKKSNIIDMSFYFLPDEKQKEILKKLKELNPIRFNAVFFDEAEDIKKAFKKRK